MDTLTVKESNPVGFREEQYPPEIWEEIGKRLLRRLDIARFRSVCKTWRSLLPSPSPFPLRVPPPPIMHSDDHCVIHELSYYAVETESKSDQANRMLVLREAIDQDGYKIVLCGFLPPPLVGYSPIEKVKIAQISSRDSLLCKSYSLRTWTRRSLDFDQQTVFISSNSTSLDPNHANKCDVTVVTRMYTGELALLRLGECDGLHHDPLPLNWLLLNWKTDFCSFSVRDIISYNGKLYTVETSGRAFAMEYHSLHMTQVAAPLSAQLKLMKLVESLGELYLLVVSSLNRTELKVYKLRSELQQWHEVTDLGDRVFILSGADCFSVARDVFADSVLMDLKYEARLGVSPPCVVFSAQLPRSGGGGGGPRSRICVVPLFGF